MVVAFWYSLVMDYCLKRVHSLKIILKESDFEAVEVKDKKSGNKIEVPSVSLHKFGSELHVEDFEDDKGKVGLGKIDYKAYGLKNNDHLFYM
jgi:hypothetical protein